MNKTIVFYDQSCSMCVGVTGWLSRIDGKKQFRLEPYQNEDLVGTISGLDPAEMAKQIHVVSSKGEILKGADAMMEIWRKTGHWTAFMAYILRMPPFIWLARLVYNVVARYRKLF